MPTIFILYGIRFFFYSREESRMHVHVEYQENEAKIWMDTFEVAENYSFKNYELLRVLKLVRLYEKDIKEAWISHFGRIC